MSTVAAEPSAQGQWEAWKRKELPPAEQVRPGLWSVPVPIPHNPLRYTITYLSVADDGVVVVDPGWFATETWDALVAGLSTAGASVSDVVGVVVTHIHADHHGLSARLKQESGAWIAMHPAEREVLPARLAATTVSSFDRDWLRSSGVPTDVAAKLSFDAESMKPFMELAMPDILLADGDLVPSRAMRAVWTPGHTPGHICLYDQERGVLLTGDHVLPRISPNIGMMVGDDDPLSSYIASLERIAAFDDAEVLPAHEYRFHGVARRTLALIRHHQDRCDEITRVLRENGESTTWEITERLTWSRGWENVRGIMRRSAVAETGAHLQYMRKHGAVELVDGEVRRWRAGM
ncbi:MBL fold metallo-hydrolase [Kibdelosporangium persicum]|uniref:Hydroxyacylglutathione hydrolase n=1 Tax=Kibdelosporangium persicum TaxID=2698649 RepID=A0ABX2EVD4_9PSEU|nr:MBL fold metallo-hydrolase [Kibdelosporangium persicum]NRN62991.1 Hydroxyacylglutathione hydrolase [Kibdelosporangium persicum]